MLGGQVGSLASELFYPVGMDRGQGGRVDADPLKVPQLIGEPSQGAMSGSPGWLANPGQTAHGVVGMDIQQGIQTVSLRFRQTTGQLVRDMAFRAQQRRRHQTLKNS